MSETIGYTKGELCNRNNCIGIIDEHEKEGSCSCHINPPCSKCTTDTSYCPVCGWEAQEEIPEPISELQKEQYRLANEQYSKAKIEHEKLIDEAYSGKIKLDKLEWYVTESWHSGYRAKGYAPNMGIAQILGHLGLDKYNLPKISVNEFGGFTLSAFTD